VAYFVAGIVYVGFGIEQLSRIDNKPLLEAVDHIREIVATAERRAAEAAADKASVKLAQ